MSCAWAAVFRPFVSFWLSLCNCKVFLVNFMKRNRTENLKAQSTQDAGRDALKFEHFSFDVACMQCGHPYSYQQVPFVCFALRVTSRVLCGLGRRGFYHAEESKKKDARFGNQLPQSRIESTCNVSFVPGNHAALSTCSQQ